MNLISNKHSQKIIYEYLNYDLLIGKELISTTKKIRSFLNLYQYYDSYANIYFMNRDKVQRTSFRNNIRKIRKVLGYWTIK